MIQSRRLMVQAALITGIVALTPTASATVCDRSKIRALPISEAAKSILDNSDVIGVGSASEERSEPNVLRQQIVFTDLVKGKEQVVFLSPYRSAGVGIHDGWVRQFQAHPMGGKLFALTKQNDGYVAGKCILTILANFPQEQMLTALNREANKQYRLIEVRT